MAERQSIITTLTLAPDRRETLKMDPEMMYFGVRLRRGARGRVVKSYVMQYTLGGRVHRVPLGAADTITETAAREKAREIMARVKQQQWTITICTPAGEYIELRSKQPRHPRHPRYASPLSPREG